MVRIARAEDYFTICYGYTDEQTRGLAAAGADVIVPHAGWTTGGLAGAGASAMSLERPCEHVQELIDLARREHPEVICWRTADRSPAPPTRAISTSTPTRRGSWAPRAWSASRSKRRSSRPSAPSRPAHVRAAARRGQPSAESSDDRARPSRSASFARATILDRLRQTVAGRPDHRGRRRGGHRGQVRRGRGADLIVVVCTGRSRHLGVPTTVTLGNANTMTLGSTAQIDNVVDRTPIVGGARGD